SPTPSGTKTFSPEAWLEITCPSAFKAGEDVKISVKLKGDLSEINGKKLVCHLHWMKQTGWGGYDTHSRSEPTINGAGPYEFTIKPNAHDNLASYLLMIGASSTGGWDNLVKNVSASVPVGTAAAGNERQAERSRPVETPSGLIVELFAKFEPGTRGAVLTAGKLSLSVTPAGVVAFALGDATATTPSSVADGKWNHIVAENTGAELRIFINGKLAASAPFKGERVSADSAVTVGGDIDATLGFLRIALSSLEQSRTTIDELVAWQFDGPHLRDFTGKKSTPSRPAGALDY
ncbi:MAG: LamG domain-containing protein, partial [Kiritimatiellaeota bacterium]|nr:LamG domain-containing protein [Kiritimatiellota bacterium]